MSMNAIAYMGGRFYNDELSFGSSPSEIGRDIVRALLQGSETPTEFSGGKGTITVNYLLGMLRYTARTGKFYDCLDDTCDHNFDPNTPTPGGEWAEVQELRRQAKELEFEARDIRDSEIARHLSGQFAAMAAECRYAADLQDGSKLGLRPLRAGLTVPTAKCWNSKVGTDAIWFDGQVFKFGGFYASPTIVGRMIVTSLLRGEEWVRVGEMDVTVNYLVQMCREVGKHGKFVDYLEDDFDANVAPDMGIA